MQKRQKLKEKLETRSTKKKKQLVEYKIISDINLIATINLLLTVFTETAPEVESNKKK